MAILTFIIAVQKQALSGLCSCLLSIIANTIKDLAKKKRQDKRELVKSFFFDQTALKKFEDAIDTRLILMDEIDKIYDLILKIRKQALKWFQMKDADDSIKLKKIKVTIKWYKYLITKMVS